MKSALRNGWTRTMSTTQGGATAWRIRSRRLAGAGRLSSSLRRFWWFGSRSIYSRFWGLQFDPKPFILLNLILSFIAAFQAPIIMMSQNRQAARDKHESIIDFAINYKAEQEWG